MTGIPALYIPHPKPYPPSPVCCIPLWSPSLCGINTEWPLRARLSLSLVAMEWRTHSALIHSAVAVASPQTCICQPQPHQRGGRKRQKGEGNLIPPNTKDAEREAESAKLSEMLQNPLIGMIRARHSRNPKLKKKTPRKYAIY